MAEHPKSEENISSLLNDLSKIGIILESREDIVLLVQSYEKKLQELKKDINNFRENSAKKEEELLSWMTKHIEDRQTISRLEEQVREHTNNVEENIYETIRKGSADRTTQLNDIIGLLENEKSDLRNENDSLKKKLENIEHDHSDENIEKELQKQVITLKEENADLFKQVESSNAEIIEFRKKVDHLQHLLSTSENGGKEKSNLFEELDDEMTKLTKVELELNKMRKDNYQLKISNDEMKDEVVFLKSQRGEADFIKKQRDLEYNFALEQVSALKKEKCNLMEELEEKVKEIHDMKENIAKSKEAINKFEDLQSDNQSLQNQLKKDKDAFQVELDVVRSQKERSKVELTSLKKELDIKNNIITEKEMVIRDLKERQNPQEISYNESLYAERDNALHVTLKKVNVNGFKQFGVFLASRPSRVLITDAIEVQKRLVRAGDYVLSINGVNVQNATNEFVWSLTSDDFMDMVLLRPVANEQEYEVRNQEKGLKVEHSLKVSHLTTTASNAGIRVGDEIIKINGLDVQSLSVSKIEKKISNPSVRLYIRRTEEIVQSVMNASSDSYESNHPYETIESTSPRSSFRREVMNRSRMSLASSHSSSSRSTNVMPGQPEHQRRDVIEADFRRTSTYASQNTQYVQPVNNAPSEHAVAVASEGSSIRNYDTEGSGDSEVAREMPKQRRSREERKSTNEDGYVDMRGVEQELLRPTGQRGGALSDISEASFQNGGSFHGSSEFEQERQSSHTGQSPTLPPRPQQALPGQAVQAKSTEYHYVDHERKYSRQGQLLDITLKKSASDSSFGFTIFGGNVIGIFVDQVDCSSPAGREELPRGARIISINGYDVTDTAFCFAAETMRGLEEAAILKLKAIFTSADQLAKYRLQRPYDLFTVRALVDAPKMSACTLPFNENDLLTITDTYENFDPETGAYLWHAMKTVEGGVIREGSIPAEQSTAVPFSDDYPEAFEVYGAMKVKEKPGILKALRRKPSSDKIKDIIVFPHGYLYRYMDESIRV